MKFSILLLIYFIICWFCENCNLMIYINPYLFLDLKISEKNQKKLYIILKERFDVEKI